LPVKDLEITSKDGLPSNGVRSLAFDNFNRIWVATLSGIVIIEIDSSQNNSVTINQIGYEHGITTDYWAEVKLAKDGDGNIWAGLYDQLIRFDPSQIKFVKATPFIAIDNIQLNLKETDWSGWTDSLSGILQIPYQPVLPYNKNSLGISFKGISFSYVSGMEYSYKLDGADTNWSVPTHSEFVSFMGLPPGNYTFQVRAKKSNSGWCKPAVFSFVIKKPYWTTWWFRILMIAGLTGAAYLFYRFRINQLRKVMALRTKISRDLHDEVGSTLSGIGIISEMAKHDLENENSSEVKKSLDKISVNTEEMLGKMSDIIWAINPQNDSFDKIINRLESYAKSIASSSGVQLHFKTDEEVKQVNLDMQERNNIYLICKEAINNAIKYSGSQQLLFIIEKNNRQVRIAVKDDGKGFNAEQLFDGNGLKNMKARAKEIKANLNIVSGNGGGTAIELSLNIT
ncbi:MAG TPA: triple tyrosine motif-containing protein, partial [Chitinophagaceae bacterium]|nr:triple tyrosine motif-containing protein [Chitinophagaceae bacterium]